MFIEGNSLMYLLAKFLAFGKLLPSPINMGGLPLPLYWLKFFFTGQPFPLGGTDVFIHPVAFAGWAGLLVTALNLIPAGTLDGGHILFSLFGDRTRKFYPFIMVILVGLGFVWSGWWLWAAMLFLLGRVYAEPLDQITSLDPTRKVLAVLALVIFVLAFTPVPFIS
jgi:membrane-associated protease RseP (regulator of RpoE activity)